MWLSCEQVFAVVQTKRFLEAIWFKITRDTNENKTILLKLKVTILTLIPSIM